MPRYLLLLVAFGLAVFTQVDLLVTVPGFHFDEAWQAMFAHRIMSEPGFHPLSAMNSYTTPIVHYALALIFKIFGPSLLVLRAAYAAMNLLTMGLIAHLLWKRREHLAAIWFILLWALLPLSVHNHRFYVEATGFHGFCLAVVLWGVSLWKRKPVLASVMIVTATVLGTYSHILFISIFIAVLAAAARVHPKEFKSDRARLLVMIIAFLLVPLPIRMGIGLGKITPFLLAAALVATGACTRFEFWKRLPEFYGRIEKYLWFGSIPFLFAFVFLLWNGAWPYAQATGHLSYWLLIPINVVLFLPALRSRDSAWSAFVACFAVTSLLILKQSPRYYTLPMIFGMIWVARELAQVRKRELQAALAFVFAGWNLLAFQTAYIDQFEREGSTTHEFKIGIFHDNGRDFRPFQNVFAWAIKQNCRLDWVEDDRFARAVEFMKLTAPTPKGRCPWKEENLFFSHIPNYDAALNGHRNDANTPPPVPNVKFLAHFPEWGDLAVWIRR